MKLCTGKPSYQRKQKKTVRESWCLSPGVVCSIASFPRHLVVTVPKKYTRLIFVVIFVFLRLIYSLREFEKVSLPMRHNISSAVLRDTSSLLSILRGDDSAKCLLVSWLRISI